MNDLDDAAAAQVVALDFECKREMPIALSQVHSAMEAGQFVWIDLDVGPATRQQVLRLQLVDEEVLDVALREEPSTQYARYDGYLHLVVAALRVEGPDFELQRLSVILGERFLLTLHHGPSDLVSAVRRDYHADFIRFARSPSFLLYEIWDHLIDNYLAMQKLMGERVEALQAELHSGNVDDQVFARVSALGTDLLHFRKILLPARTVLTDLSNRRSLLLSEATQRFLATMVGTVDHVLQDMLVDRDILAQSLNLYMSLVTHRTNAVMKRLTVVSVVFLPLTFLVGIYGMNFEVLPELKWRFGYAYFWIVAAVIVAVILRIIRRSRML